MSLRFRKRKEDFVCEHCGAVVRGDGFTNHCPQCLWSKHVDVFPGDREAVCGGLMEPITLALSRSSYVITHRCVKCGFEKRNRTSKSDNLGVLLSNR